MSAHSRALAALWLVLAAGCGHRRMGLPGPLGALGGEVEEVEEEAVAWAGELEQGGEELLVTRDSPRRARRGEGRGAGDVARAAGELVGKRKLTARGQSYRYDCSGMVCAAYARSGRDLSGSSRDLHELARSEGLLHRRKEPSPGDVAFFDDTYDRNGNGRRDDELSHVAVVESVDGDGTITLVHLGGRGVVRIRMNLRQPGVHRDAEGKVLNDYLRSGRDDGGPRLAGELHRDFGSLWRLDQDGNTDAAEL